MTKIDIVPIETQISPDMLDTIGKSFKFKHAKGVAEWLKNSLDNYLRLHEIGIETRDGSWPVLLSLSDGKTNKSGPNLAVVDFGGTTYQALDDFFLYWGSRTAATHGATSSAAVTGGHGNGGKFYMREMWRNGARFATWRDGHMSSLVVKKTSDGKTGYWEVQNQQTSWQEALEIALPRAESLGGQQSIIDHLQRHEPNLIQELNDRKRGFSVVVGKCAEQVLSANDVVIGGRWNHQKLIDELRDASQARRPIRELAIAVLVNGELAIPRLLPAAVEEDPEWPSVRVDLLPQNLSGRSQGESGEDFGHLIVTKSAAQLQGRYKDLNSVFVLDRRNNPIAHYPFSELPFPGHSPSLSFFSAELYLTFPGIDDLVENDRERLIPSETTTEVLHWTADQIWARVVEVEKSQRTQERASELQKAAILNDALNRHAKRFLEELQTEIMVDFIQDDEGGGLGNEGEGQGGTGKGSGGDSRRESGSGGSKGEGGTTEVDGTSQPKRRPKFPQVLLSGTDMDPANPGETKQFTDRHPPLEQDDIDKTYNVWWINTKHPFAEEALKRGGAEGHAFKNHQLYMFRDVVQREALRFLQRRESELGLDRVENELSEASNRFLAELPYDLLQEFLS